MIIFQLFFLFFVLKIFFFRSRLFVNTNFLCLNITTGSFFDKILWWLVIWCTNPILKDITTYYEILRADPIIGGRDRMRFLGNESINASDTFLNTNTFQSSGYQDIFYNCFYFRYSWFLYKSKERDVFTRYEYFFVPLVYYILFNSLSLDKTVLNNYLFRRLTNSY